MRPTTEEEKKKERKEEQVHKRVGISKSQRNGMPSELCSGSGVAVILFTGLLAWITSYLSDRN